MTKLGKHVQISGVKRAKLTEDVTARYAAGASIRDLAQHYGRSYGFIHRIVDESDTELRGRGGSYRLAERAKA